MPAPARQWQRHSMGSSGASSALQRMLHPMAVDVQLLSSWSRAHEPFEAFPHNGHHKQQARDTQIAA
jgi:hypothetical protein